MRSRIQWSMLSLSLLALAGCRAGGFGKSAEQKPRLFPNMGNYQRSITTNSPEAKKYFDQGLVWTYAFNHDEAIRSFEQAAMLDPECAMAWWGIAYCHGPHINNPVMTPERSQAAWSALVSAVKTAKGATSVEKDLINALTKRYENPPPADRKPLDEAYANAMREIWKKNVGDLDVSTLFAESLMNLRPWDLWTKDGYGQPGTSEILAILESVLSRNPDHPGANHLYIHSVESSPHPEKGIAAADKLRTLVPAAGHLVHMPAHIDVRTGQWEKAATSNINAIAADRKYRKWRPRHGFYHVYMAHNHHFLSFACMMEGRKKDALKAAREMIAGVPEDYLKDNAAFVDGAMMIEQDVLKRFGEWNAMLQLPQPPANLPITAAWWRFSRGVAFAAKGDIQAAEKEKMLFAEAIGRVPADAVMAINPAHKVLGIAQHMLNGEIAFRKGNVDDAVASLREAVKIEDDLKYMEPPEWIQPVRHTLGAFLLSDGRYDEAEQVYREDLAKFPENGWSLFGLWKCQQARGATAEAVATEQRFNKAWARADTKIGASCLCVKGS